MNQVWKLWPYFALVVTKSVYFLLNLIGPTSFIDKYTLQFGNFAAKIAQACSGTYSIFIFTAIYIFIVLMDWKKLNKLKAALIFIPAIVGAFIVNILRVTLLMIVGHYISREAALGLYHSYTGMIFFLIYFLIFWTIAYNWMRKKEFKKKNKEKNPWMKKKYAQIMGDSLYQNSIYLMLNTIIITGLGFFFWIINTRLFSPEDIGLATALISVMGVIIGFSVLGFNTGLIRFLPQSKHKNNKINTSLSLVMVSTIIVTSIFLMFADKLSPKLIFVRENIIFGLIFILFMVIASFNSMIESIFTAYRSTKYILIKNFVFSVLKLIFPFFLVFLGAFGIFSSWILSMFIASILSFIILVIKFDYIPKLEFKDSVIKIIGRYSFGNYVADFVGGLPLLILPILILNKLGAETTAYYYMAMMIAALLFAIPTSASQSLFAEGSHSNKYFKKQIKKASKIILFLLIPSTIVIIFFSRYLLLLFGKEYALEGFRFLQIIALSGLFVGVNKVFKSLLKVKNKVKTLIWVNLLTSLLIIGLSYILINRGLIGIALSWIIGQAIISLIVIVALVFQEKSKSI